MKLEGDRKLIRRERRDGGEARGNEEREKRRESRERIEIERKEKETNGNWDDNLKEEVEEHRHLLCLLFSFLKALRYSSEDTSSRLDSAVKQLSSEETSEVLTSMKCIDLEIVDVAKWQ